jgi:hypothetical protein
MAEAVGYSLSLLRSYLPPLSKADSHLARRRTRAVDKEPGWNVAVRGLEGFFWRVWQFPDVLTPCQFIF